MRLCGSGCNLALPAEKRALARAHMDEARFNQIIAAQMPNAEKCQRADYIIPTSFGISAMQWYIAQMLNDIILRGKPMREIVLDTETTGLKHEEGHRIIEIGALELNDYIPTGTHYHVRINPERDIDAEASKVHGMTAESLKHEPLFADIADEFPPLSATTP